MLVMCARLWQTLGLDDVQLQINTHRQRRGAARVIARELLAYLRAHRGRARRRRASAGCIRNPLRVLDSKNPAMQPLIEAAPRLIDDLGDGVAARISRRCSRC